MSCEGCPLFGNCPVNRIGEVMLTEDVITVDFNPNMEAATADFNLLRLANSPNPDSALARRCSETLAERMIAYSFEEDQAERNNTVSIDIVQQAIKHNEAKQASGSIIKESTIAPLKVAAAAERLPRRTQVKASYQKDLDPAIVESVQKTQATNIQKLTQKAQEIALIDEDIQRETAKAIVLEPLPVQNTSQAPSSIEKTPVIAKAALKKPLAPTTHKPRADSLLSPKPKKTREVITEIAEAVSARASESALLRQAQVAEHTDQIENPIVESTVFLAVEAPESSLPVGKAEQAVEDQELTIMPAAALDEPEPIISVGPNIEDLTATELDEPLTIDIYEPDLVLVNDSEVVDNSSEVLPDIEIVVYDPLYSETVVVSPEADAMPDSYLLPPEEPIKAVTVQEAAQPIYYSSIFEKDSEPAETTKTQEIRTIESTTIDIASELPMVIEQAVEPEVAIQEYAIYADLNISLEDEPLKLIRQYDVLDHEPYLAGVELASPDDFWLEGEILRSSTQPANDKIAVPVSGTLTLLRYVMDSLITKPLAVG